MHKFKRLIFLNFNEFIIPSQRDNLITLIKDLKKLSNTTHEAISYQLSNSFFFNELPMNDKSSFKWNLITLKKVYGVILDNNNSNNNNDNYQLNSIIDTSSCLIVVQGNCKYFTKLYDFNGKVLNVPRKIGKTHNYQNCKYKKDVCLNLFNNIYKDNNVEKFKSKLIENVRKVSQNFGVFFFYYK